MPDAQIHPTGTVATPADYVVPDSAELLLKGVYAEFDGSGAAGSYLPLVRIISDAGSTVIEAVSDTSIAAGASADASWFPHLAAAAAAATGTAALPLAIMTRVSTQTFASSVNDQAITWERFHTTDTATFQLLGSSGVRVKTDGVYAAWINIAPDSDWPTSPTTPIQIQVQVPGAGSGDVVAKTFAVHPAIDVFSPTSFVTDAPSLELFPLLATRTVTGGLFNNTGSNFVISGAAMWVMRVGDYIDGSP